MQSFGSVHLFNLASPCLDSLSRVMGLKKKAVWPSCEGMACEAYHKPEGISPTGKILKVTSSMSAFCGFSNQPYAENGD